MGARGYGLTDLGFAGLYAWLGFVFAPSRSRVFELVLGAVVALLACAGVGLVVAGERSRAARTLGIVACTVLLAFTAACVILLGMSCAFLFGVYGAIGRGLGVGALLIAALTVEVFGLLPLFQLRFHLRSR